MLEVLRPGSTAVDVGAYKGVYLYWMRRATGQTGSVFCFEPQPAAAEKLRRIVKAARWSNVTIEELALSNALGEAALFLPPGGSGTFSAATLDSERWGDDGGIQACRTTSLDVWARGRELDALDFIKCDVEGHELEVLRGATSSLARWHPTLLVECETRYAGQEAPARLFALLEELGYRGWFFHARERLPIERFDSARHQREEDFHAGRVDTYANNFFFVHP